MLGLLLLEAAAQSLFGPAPRTESLLIVRDTIVTEQQVLPIDLLDANFQALADSDRLGRRLGGYTMLGLAVGAVIGGAVTLAVGEGTAQIVG